MVKSIIQSGLIDEDDRGTFVFFGKMCSQPYLMRVSQKTPSIIELRNMTVDSVHCKD